LRITLRCSAKPTALVCAAMQDSVVSALVAACLLSCGAESVQPVTAPATELGNTTLAPPPPAATPDEELPGLEPEAVVSVVTEHESAVTGCHVVGFSGQAAHSGAVTLTWRINPNGTVRDLKIADTTFDDSDFHHCILAVIEGLQFPAAPGSTEVGGWRFKFRSRGTGQGF
jgi:hypothetical protein